MTNGFLQSDTIGLGGASLGNLNTYAYVGHSPLMYIDPYGLAPNPLEVTCIDPAQPACLLGIAIDVGGDLWAAYRALQTLSTINHVLNEASDSDEKDKDKPVAAAPLDKPNCPPGSYRPDRPLPRDPKSGEPLPDPLAEGPHTQLGKETDRNGEYTIGREFDKNGQWQKEWNFTDHGRPQTHPNPHIHQAIPNPTGGTPQRGPAEAP